MTSVSFCAFRQFWQARIIAANDFPVEPVHSKRNRTFSKDHPYIGHFSRHFYVAEDTRSVSVVLSADPQKAQGAIVEKNCCVHFEELPVLYHMNTTSHGALRPTAALKT